MQDMNEYLEPVRYNEGKVDWTYLPWDNQLLWWLNEQFTDPVIINKDDQRRKLISMLIGRDVHEVLFYSLALTEDTTVPYKAMSINLPWDALEDVCRVFMYAVETKYPRDNYKLAPGLPLESYIQSMWRHLVEYLRGEEVDIESKLPHLSHLACNAFMYLWTQKEYHVQE